MRRWLIFLLVPIQVAAMDMKVVGDQLIMSGRIDGSELARLRDIFAEHDRKSIRTVILRNSPGGDHWTSLRVAEIIRDSGWRTAISGYCFSGCSTLFLGGVSRHFASDKSVGLTQVAFHGTYASSSAQHDLQDGLVQRRTGETRDWARARTNGQMPEALIDRMYGIANRRGMVHFFDSRRLRRKDGASVFHCSGEEERKKKWDQCEKLLDVDVYRVGIVTSPELVVPNDAPAK